MMSQTITGKEAYDKHKGKEVTFCGATGRIVGYRPNKVLIAEVIETQDFTGWKYKNLTDGDWVEIDVNPNSKLMYISISRLEE